MSERLENARRLAAHSRRQAGTAQNVVRATVSRKDPLQVEFLTSDRVLDDDDLTSSAWMRLYRREFGLEVGDTVMLHREGSEYVMFDVLPEHDLDGKGLMPDG